MSRTETGRTLKTAQSVLRVQRYLYENPHGATVEEVAGFVDKSAATASYLLNTLVQEGFASRAMRDGHYVYKPEFPMSLPRLHVSTTDFATLVQELSERAGQRAYLATQEGDNIVVQEVAGRRDWPVVPGLQPIIRGEAHALAIGKAILANAKPGGVVEYLDVHGLRSFTPRTIVDPRHLEVELRTVRRVGYAADREEFAPGFCCVSAAIWTDDGQFIGALGMSVDARRFREDGLRLSAVVRRLAEEAGHHPAVVAMASKEEKRAEAAVAAVN